jgi:hypothetical protein
MDPAIAAIEKRQKCFNSQARRLVLGGAIKTEQEKDDAKTAA